MDSKLFTLHTIETLWNKIKNKFYVKSADGIPKSDLDITVQSSLSKADSALQEHQDISGKQDKSTAVTHTASVAVGSTTKPAYIAANGAATPISHSINSDVPANAKFTDTTYNDVTQTTHGLMTAADKKKLDGMDSTKYLPLSGGVMVGDIDTRKNKAEVIIGAHRSDSGYATPVCGGIIEQYGVFTDTLKSYRSFIGSYRNAATGAFYNLISVRHRNGHNDGDQFGMYLYSDLVSGGNLYWNKQTAANTWQGDRMLLDSANYTDYALVKDGTAKKAETLTDSGWIIPTFPSGIKRSSIRYRKQGKIVSVSGYVTFSEATSAKVVLTLPEGYRPPAKVKQFCAVDSSSQASFLTTIDTDGNVNFVGKTQGFFTTETEYYMHCTFFVD